MSSSILPTRTDVLDLVQPEFREAFLRFVDTGELDPEFEQYLDQDELCQRAVEAAADAQLEGLSAAGRRLRENEAVSQVSSSDMAGEPEAASMLAVRDRALEEIAAGIELVVSGAAQVGSTDMAEVTPEVVRQLDSALNAQRITIPSQAEYLSGIVEFARKVADAAREQELSVTALRLTSSR